ncbi:MAG: hypothetical protein HQL82_17385 [Magnetococcales bacterium]|nr:hypothetical protein [Magnetococcales bacterium]
MSGSVFKRIGIITKRSDHRAVVSTGWLARWLADQGLEVTVTDETSRAAGILPGIAMSRPQEEVAEGQDLVLVLGGMAPSSPPAGWWGRGMCR